MTSPRPAKSRHPKRFTLRPLPPDVYAELAVLRATADATTYEILCAGVYALARLTPDALRAVVLAFKEREP